MRGISKLASELGISTGTVSRALNGMPGVHERTRQRVLEAAQRLGYEPNQAARTLALGQTKSIGFMIDLEPEAAAAGDSFFIGVFDGVQSVLSKQGYDLVVLPSPRNQDRLAHLDRVVTRRVVDGMIISGTEREDPRIDLLRSNRMPFVSFGRTVDATGYSWVDLDFEGVADDAIDRLAALGHRRIAVTIPFGDLNFGVLFHGAYQRALARNGIEYDPELVFHTGFGEEDGYLLVDSLIGRSDPATAILLIFEAASIGIYRRLAELGMKPGRDLSIIGFRNESMIRYLQPRLTCYELSVFDVGDALARALLAQIAPQDKVRPLAQITIPMTIRPGDSDRRLARSVGNHARRESKPSQFR